MHALLDPLFGAHRDPEQLDAVAEFVGGLDIFRRDRRDAFDEDRRLVDPDAEGEAGEDRELLGGVVALAVEARIGLRLAEPLGVGEAGREGTPPAFHPGGAVVAWAIQAARDAGEGMAGAAL